MNIEFARQAWRSAMPRPAIPALPRQAARPVRSRTGSKTTILAAKIQDGLVFGADCRVSDDQWTLVSEDERKIDQITPSSAIATSGLVCAGQLVVEALRVESKQYENTTGYVLSMNGQARIASRVCRDSSLDDEYWEFSGIYAGLDEDDTPRIFEVEASGGRVEHVRWYASGSGGPSARVVLMEHWRAGMALNDGLYLAVKALYLAGLSNVGTSDLRITVPTLAAITPQQDDEERDEFRFVNPEIARDLRDRVQRELEGVR